jgi:hypothetical protein
MSKEKISTKDVQVGGGLSKTIQPGEHLLKINGVRLERFPFMEADEGYFLIFDTETKPIEGFEGFFIDKEDESKGRYLGQIGQVKTNRFYYKDGTTKSGVKVVRDMEILKQIKNLCIIADCLSWFEKANDKFDTIEALVTAFDKAGLFKKKYFKFCIAGKEFMRDNGFIGYDLFLPKLERGRIAYEAENTKPSKLLTYDESKHLIKAEVKETTEFAGDVPAAGEIPVDNGPDFKDAPDFTL